MSKFEIYLVGMIISAVVFCVAVFVLCRKEDEGLFMKILFFSTFSFSLGLIWPVSVPVALSCCLYVLIEKLKA